MEINTISLESECISGFHIRHRLLQGAQARSALAIEDINPTLQVFPEALHRVQLGAVGRQPHQDNILRQRDALRYMR